MNNILYKEIKLSASKLTFLFVLFSFMFFLPGYPVLCGTFFVTLGIFQSFQSTRETNDTLFSALLPVKKRDVVKGKFLFVCLVELSASLLMLAAVILRMTVFKDSNVYRSNALMNGNFFALGLSFFIFGLFNFFFVGGFYKTAYKFSTPFLTYIILCFVSLTIGEALHHFPGLEALNAFGTDNFMLQILLLFCGIIAYAFLTVVSLKNSCNSFEKIDL